jgi:chemotaxis-related protein WspD
MKRLAASPTKAGPCWKIAGVWGDRTCPELAAQVHCRNCPTLKIAAARVLDQTLTSPDIAQRSAVYAIPKAAEESTVSLVIFRIGPEWFALASAKWREVTARRRPHSLPQRRNAALLGIVNIRGRLVPCVDLHAMLGLATVSLETCPRLAVIESPAGPWAFPAEEFAGVFACDPGARRKSPSTRGASTCIQGVFDWRQNTVGWIDEDRLWAQLEAVVA